MVFVFFFFFQAEDGIRDIGVTGVQTCALPICTFCVLLPNVSSDTLEKHNFSIDSVSSDTLEKHNFSIDSVAGGC